MSAVDFSHAGYAIEHAPSTGDSTAETVLARAASRNPGTAHMTDLQWNDGNPSHPGEPTDA